MKPASAIHGLLRLVPALILSGMPQLAGAQETLWVGRIGNDTAVVEAAKRTGSRIEGTIVNVAAGLLVSYYEADMAEDGTLRRFRQWTVRDLSAPPPRDAVPSVSIEMGTDSLRVVTVGRDGQSRVTTVPAVRGAVPIFDTFFNNPMSLMDVALSRARDTRSMTLPLYYIGGRNVEKLTLTQGRDGRVSYPYITARQYAMLGEVNLHATLDERGMMQFDATETTFKILTERRPWADAMALARSFKERGLGAGGFSTMSPATSAAGKIGDAEIRITYGSPRQRGRRVFPDVVPYGKVWRAGANSATQVSFSRDVTVAGRPVPAGSYSLWVIPSEPTDTLIVNKATRIWGVMYDAAQDLVRVPMRREMLAAPVDALSYAIRPDQGGAWLDLAWADRRMSVRIQPAAR